MSPHDPLRLGMIGAGRWAGAYLRTARAMPDLCRIVLVARRSPTAMDAPFHDVPVVSRWQDLLSEGSLDGIIIASPPSCHAEQAVAAVNAGMPVLVEKPLALDVAGALAIRDAVRARGGTALVDHTHTFHPAFRAIRAAMRNPPLRIDSLSGGWGPFRADCGSLWDWGAHDVAMALLLAGESPRRTAVRRLESRRVGDGVGESFRLELEFPGGSSARLEFGNLLEHKTRRLAVADARDRLLYDDLHPPCLFGIDSSYDVVSASGGTVRPLPCPEILPLGVALREFCERVVRADAACDSVELGLQVVEVLAGAERHLGPATHAH